MDEYGYPDCIMANASFQYTMLEPDCDVDLDDLTFLVSHWLQICGDCDGADLLEDGIVNLADFAVLAENWLTQ